MYPITKVAVVQAAPVLFDVAQSIKKVAKFTKEAAAKGAKIVLFPETFISVYPRGLSFGTVVGSRSKEGRATWLRYVKSAIEVPSAASDQLAAIAAEQQVYLVVGITEKSSIGGSLYCSLVYYNPKGQLMGIHRKVKPTGAERIIWGEGDGSDIQVFTTPFGKIGGLICWENYMPLARMKLYEQGVSIYLAPTADSRDAWVASMRHIALEGRCYVLSCNQYITKDLYPADLPGIEDLNNQEEIMCRGGSVIINPLGNILAGPLYNKEGILYAAVDPSEVLRAKLDFDVIGHYRFI